MRWQNKGPTEHYDRINNPYVNSFTAPSDIPEDDYSEESGPDCVYSEQNN